MIIFFIKSTVCLFVLYGFYHLFLRNQKVLLFNRFYLAFSLFFSIITSLIVIPVKSDYSLNTNIDKFTTTTGYFIKGNTIIEDTYSLFTVQNILFSFYVVITSILLIRFALNIFRLLKKIIKNKKVDYQKTSLVLIKERSLPYSFFKYVFVNRSDYENGNIEKELLMHEEAHCLQYHSIDIIIIELINVFLWFNPAIWLIKKAILLNHEFLADSTVLSTVELDDYQNTLLNLVLRNNSVSLASNFNYSLTKKRLIMMNRKTEKDWAILRKITIIPLFLILVVTLAFSQENLKNGQKEGANYNKTIAVGKKGITLYDEQKAASEEQNLSFQERLENERKAASKEQTPSFQEGLAKERKAADEEQTPSFQERLAKERKAADEGTIVVTQK
jgi:beta-lactamase regulating signal transducer with metallopeptidase domain